MFVSHQLRAGYAANPCSYAGYAVTRGFRAGVRVHECEQKRKKQFIPYVNSAVTA